MKELNINGRKISQNRPCYFIADIAANHDGDLSRAKDLIYLAKDAGADAAKFQHFRAETIVSDKGFANLGTQVSHQAKWEKSVSEVYRDATVPASWTAELAETCQLAGIDFFTSPYEKAIVDEVDPYVPAYKIGSGDITWIEQIEHVCSKNKPVILAAGASNLTDVQRAMDVMMQKAVGGICLMQCNTNYTAAIENMHYINLRVLETFKSMYPAVPLGLSDHTPGHASVLGAIALGACMVEKHFTDDTTRVGPDHLFSMDAPAWRDMVDRSRELEAALGTGNKKVEENESETVVIQRRCIRMARNIEEGEILTEQDLKVLRPAPKGSIPPYKIQDVIGKTANRRLEKGEHLSVTDLC
ncbi:N-acetylneuraminate synthase family protein [Persicirhabdus sediminis]|uniref:N-acetylneuraminate synthase family protein n=1 Tax=Persicirhabdus sediminis TaxID=454144 RepID=A0A8J7SNM8_9BACT|nr:N-acetylneuraminate synthase family protein [Persicirhabdus sediminis]MBK1792775.1 N-acetylneuraminate synthase family protein [Persicirhabdus sediminis]